MMYQPGRCFSFPDDALKDFCLMDGGRRTEDKENIRNLWKKCLRSRGVGQVCYRSHRHRGCLSVGRSYVVLFMAESFKSSCSRVLRGVLAFCHVV